MEDKHHRTQVLHNQRAFLAPDDQRWNGAACVTYVHAHSWDDQEPGDLDIEAEVTIIDPDGHTARFDGSYRESADAHLSTLDALIAQLSDYRAAYVEARGQALSGTPISLSFWDGIANEEE